jgi:hypothetical protein
MQLKDLVKPIDQMSDEELLERLRQIRHRRTTERPVAKAREVKEEKRASRGRMTALDKALASLSPEDRDKLMKSLEEPNGEGSSG